MTEPPPLPATWRGRFHDGLTAARRSVRVTLGADHLEIADEAGAPITRWRLADLQAIESLRDGAAAILAPAPGADARLTLAEPPHFAALRAAAPQLAPALEVRLAHGARRAALWTLAIAALIAALWSGWPRLADGLGRLLPASVEARIGAEARRQLVEGARECHEPGGEALLDRMVARLSDAMPQPLPVTVVVVDRPIVNAVALPGNIIVLFRQLIADAQSPEELAGVVAHEMGHVAARHAIRNVMRQAGLAVIVMALSGSSNFSGLGQALLGAAYTRELEAEADRVALETLAAAGIGSQGWIDFFSRDAGDRAPGRLERALGYLSTHPASADRMAAAERLPRTGAPLLTAGEWLALRAICAKPRE